MPYAHVVDSVHTTTNDEHEARVSLFVRLLLCGMNPEAKVEFEGVLVNLASDLELGIGGHEESVTRAQEGVADTRK